MIGGVDRTLEPPTFVYCGPVGVVVIEVNTNFRIHNLFFPSTRCGSYLNQSGFRAKDASYKNSHVDMLLASCSIDFFIDI